MIGTECKECNPYCTLDIFIHYKKKCNHIEYECVISSNFAEQLIKVNKTKENCTEDEMYFNIDWELSKPIEVKSIC